MNKVDILGTEYKIINKVEPEKMPNLAGRIDYYTKEIWIVDFDKTDNTYDVNIFNETLRHEILHAFLFESGLHGNTFYEGAWAQCEEMTDWFAMQAPKIYNVYKELDIL